MLIEEYEKLSKIDGLPNGIIKRVVFAGGTMFYNDKNPSMCLAIYE